MPENRGSEAVIMKVLALWLPSPSCCPSLARVRANTHAQPAWNVLFLGTQTAGSRLQPWRDDKHLFYPGLYFSHGL